MPVYNAWSSDRNKKKAVLANSLEEFMNKGMVVMWLVANPLIERFIGFRLREFFSLIQLSSASFYAAKQKLDLSGPVVSVCCEEDGTDVAQRSKTIRLFSIFRKKKKRKKESLFTEGKIHYYR